MRAGLAWLAALLLAACAGMPEQSASALLLGPPLARFAADGRIALRNGERRDHLRFHWEHSPASDAVLLMSPLGQGLAEMTRDSRGARLVQPNQADIVADTLPELADRVFSISLPLDAVADWMRGARPELKGEVDGWQVAISETAPYRQHRLLRVMEASRGDVEFKLIVDSWETPE